MTPTTTIYREQAAQMAEVYWMALARDVPFNQFDRDPLIRAAAGTKSIKYFRAHGCVVCNLSSVRNRGWLGRTPGFSL